MTQYIYPEMRLEELFATEALQSALYRDSSPTVRAMTHYVETPAQIRGNFDFISYSKGRLSFSLKIKFFVTVNLIFVL